MEAWTNSHKSEVAVTQLLITPTRKQCRLSPESDAKAVAQTDDLLLQGHWGKEDVVGPAHKF